MNGQKIWDFSQGENILSLDWSPLGNLLGITTKDKLVHILDPRSTENSSHLSVQAHEGIKTHKMGFLDNEHIYTTGFSKNNERQIKLWDTRNFTKEY
jgi:coronin-1B/1C/6